MWDGIIKCKLAYRLVLGGRETERWVKISKSTYSYATQRVVCRSCPGAGLPDLVYILPDLMGVS